ncbi:MAG: TetR/AcrR family transcriptional regulator [Acidimicrobiales bacterium]
MPAKGSSKGHSPESLTELAVAMTREVGLDGLTVRALARQADVFPAVVYHHLGDLEAVRHAVADAVVGTIELPTAPTAPDRWRAWLVEAAEQGYRTLSAYQGVYPFIARSGPSRPNQVRVIDTVMQVLLDAGLDDEDAAYCYNAFISHVGGSADLAALFDLLVPGGGEVRADFEQRLRNVAALYPGVAAALPHFVAWDHGRAFRYTLDLLLDGITARIGR